VSIGKNKSTRRAKHMSNTMTKAYPEVQGKAVDALFSVAPPKGLTDAQLDQWLEGALANWFAMQAEKPALYVEDAIENDNYWIRTGGS
jgi:hypothetical protein